LVANRSGATRSARVRAQSTISGPPTSTPFLSP
jgi:hypothetical protein